jgi:hypothetical protein
MVSKIADAIIEGKTENESAHGGDEENVDYSAYAEPEVVPTLAEAEAAAG